jgi:hypothetical protein
MKLAPQSGFTASRKRFSTGELATEVPIATIGRILCHVDRREPSFSRPVLRVIDASLGLKLTEIVDAGRRLVNAERTGRICGGDFRMMFAGKARPNEAVGLPMALASALR